MHDVRTQVLSRPYHAACHSLVHLLLWAASGSAASNTTASKSITANTAITISISISLSSILTARLLLSLHAALRQTRHIARSRQQRLWPCRRAQAQLLQQRECHVVMRQPARGEGCGGRQQRRQLRHAWVVQVTRQAQRALLRSTRYDRHKMNFIK